VSFFVSPASPPPSLPVAELSIFADRSRFSSTYSPLAPNTCASVRLRFLAIRPGAHTLDELRLVDLGTGLETRLRNPLSVVVEG
jgi:hypothetical protein